MHCLYFYFLLITFCRISIIFVSNLQKGDFHRYTYFQILFLNKKRILLMVALCMCVSDMDNMHEHVNVIILQISNNVSYISDNKCKCVNEMCLQFSLQDYKQKSIQFFYYNYMRFTIFMPFSLFATQIYSYVL